MDITKYLTVFFSLYIIVRVCMFFTLDTECFRIASYRANKMKERKSGDIDKVEKNIKKHELWMLLNPFIWTTKQCIKDKKLYDQYLEDKKIQTKIGNKDFQDRFNNIK